MDFTGFHRDFVELNMIVHGIADDFMEVFLVGHSVKLCDQQY